MARSHPHTTRYPLALWAAIEAEAARRDTKPDQLIRTTMDAEIRKSQGDYERWFICTQSATEDGPDEGFLGRLADGVRWSLAVTRGFRLELLHALLTPRGPRGPRN